MLDKNQIQDKRRSKLEQIEINLNQSKSANSFENDNLVHQIAKDEFKLLIDKRLEELKSSDNANLLKSRIHETISILGSRGSGKSSFLLSMVQYIKNTYKKEIYVLKVTDPTLFENRQHILITIIALIKDSVAECFKCDDKDESLRNEWRRSLQKLAEGLNLLDNIGTDPMKNDGWNDSKIILERGLDQALSGESLEGNFYKFIDSSLKVLDKEAILISFDDIDTDFEKGEKVLETLRKYFRYPKIISLVAGDFDLFTKIVRQKNWKQFDGLLKFDTDKTFEIKNNVDHLEDQYLLKVLPTRSRILIGNMYSLLNNYSFNFTLNDETRKYILRKPATDKEDDLFHQLNSQYFKIQPSHIKDNNNFLQALTLLPIRSVIQFIESFLTNQELSNNNDRYFIKQILSLFSSVLSKFNIESSELESNDNYIAALTNILIDLDQSDLISINESYRLKPIYLDEAKRTIMLLLNIMTNRTFSADRSKVFEYFIKTGLTREFILGPHYKIEIVSDYKEFVGLTEQETPVKMTRRYVGFISQKFTTVFSSGFIKTYKLQNKIDQKLVEKGQTLTRKDAEQELNSFNDQFLLNILFLNIKGINSDFGSIFPLIAIMSEFTQEITTDKNEFIKDQLRNYAQFRTFNSYKPNENAPDEDTSDEDTKEREEIKDQSDNLIEDISNWIDSITSEKSNTLPIHILAKIWTRFYYSLENIAKNTKNKSFGDYIQLCVAQFLNSWIVETMLYLHEEITLDNINTSDAILKRNYKKFKQLPQSENENFSAFTKSVLDFPLWKYYLSEDTCELLYGKADNNNFLEILKKIAITKK